MPKTVKQYRVTTDSRNSRDPAPNMLAREFDAKCANEKWVSDVTFIPTREGWIFLAVVLDLYSRKIVGWSMGDRLTSELTCNALTHAIASRQITHGILVHSDRGKEYYANAYQILLILPVLWFCNHHDALALLSSYEKSFPSPHYHNNYPNHSCCIAYHIL